MAMKKQSLNAFLKSSSFILYLSLAVSTPIQAADLNTPYTPQRQTLQDADAAPAEELVFSHKFMGTLVRSDDPGTPCYSPMNNGSVTLNCSTASPEEVLRLLNRLREENRLLRQAHDYEAGKAESASRFATHMFQDAQECAQLTNKLAGVAPATRGLTDREELYTACSAQVNVLDQQQALRATSEEPFEMDLIAAHQKNQSARLDLERALMNIALSNLSCISQEQEVHHQQEAAQLRKIMDGLVAQLNGSSQPITETPSRADLAFAPPPLSLPASGTSSRVLSSETNLSVTPRTAATFQTGGYPTAAAALAAHSSAHTPSDEPRPLPAAASASTVDTSSPYPLSALRRTTIDS